MRLAVDPIEQASRDQTAMNDRNESVDVNDRSRVAAMAIGFLTIELATLNAVCPILSDRKGSNGEGKVPMDRVCRFAILTTSRGSTQV